MTCTWVELAQRGRIPFHTYRVRVEKLRELRASWEASVHDLCERICSHKGNLTILAEMLEENQQKIRRSMWLVSYEGSLVDLNPFKPEFLDEILYPPHPF